MMERSSYRGTAAASWGWWEPGVGDGSEHGSRAVARTEVLLSRVNRGCPLQHRGIEAVAVLQPLRACRGRW